MENLNIEIFKDLIDKKETFLVDFYADWCRPCRALGPILEEVEEYYKDIKFFRCNVDVENELATIFKIQSIPNVFLIKEGKVTNSFLGLKSKDDVVTWLDEITK